MKYLKDRTEIAKAMNFGKYPVIKIDIRNKPAKDYAVGDKVRVAWDKAGYEGMTAKGNVYLENGVFGISQGAAVLKNSFGRQDILENASWANTAIIHAGQKVVLVIDDSERSECSVAIMTVSDRVDIHCSTVAYLE